MRYLQIHTLTSYPGVLLNRDMVGHAKRLPVGGSPRTRVSSQCLKRHWRQHTGLHSLSSIRDNAELSIRSRITFQRFMLEPLIQEGFDPNLASMLTTAMISFVLALREPKETKEAKPEKSGPKGKGKGKKKIEPENETTTDEASDDLEPEGNVETEAPSRSGETAQVTVLGKPELTFLLGEARIIAQSIKGTEITAKTASEAVKTHFTPEKKKNLRGLTMAAGVDAAMFGRMVTSDLFARTDAAIHVAHAFSVHAEETEDDFFTAVDDLTTAEKGGSGHLSSTQLTSGLFYSYVVIDLSLLKSNMAGMPPEFVGEVVRRLVHLIATVSPGAKLGSTAPYSHARFMMLEASDEQPRTLASAFENPIKATGPGLFENTLSAFSSHLKEMDGMYGNQSERRVAAIQQVSPLSTIQHLTLPDLATWAAQKVKES